MTVMNWKVCDFFRNWLKDKSELLKISVNNQMSDKNFFINKFYKKILQNCQKNRKIKNAN